MGRLRIKHGPWKGSKLRHMARLIEFKSTESELFEALSVIHFGADQPSPKELRASIKAEEIFAKYPETKDSVFKMSGCPFCKKALVSNPRIHTLADGKGADLILDDKVFDYIAGAFDRWQIIVEQKLKVPFVKLQERFDKAKSSKLDDFDAIAAYIEKRDNPVNTATS